MPLALVSLLSQPLVAFTIELDNEYEHQALHRTTNHSPDPTTIGPWLTSFAMYANCLQHLSDVPLSVGDLNRRARMSTNLDGMRRWGYIRLSPPPGQPKQKRPNDTWLIEPTAFGRLAQEKLRPLPGLIEQRWQDRFGHQHLRALRDALAQVNHKLDVAYPDFLPILGYGLFTLGKGPGMARPMAPLAEAPLPSDAPLTALLSRLLCAFAYEFESGYPLSLAIAANLLRILDESGVRNRDLPRRTGLSKESISMALGILKRAGLTAPGDGPGNPIRLTTAGLLAQTAANERIATIERRWIRDFGEPTLQNLRQQLELLAGDPEAAPSPLLQAIKPYPDNWRAQLPAPAVLPHFPTVLHRGGFPDGS